MPEGDRDRGLRYQVRTRYPHLHSGQFAFCRISNLENLLQAKADRVETLSADLATQTSKAEQAASMLAAERESITVLNRQLEAAALASKAMQEVAGREESRTRLIAV